MKYFHILTVVLIATFLYPQDASARLFTPKKTGDYLEDYVDIDESLDIPGMTYSATWDAALDPRNLSIISIPACLYDRTQSPPKLIVNNFLMADSAQVLLGIKNANSCPLPGSTLFSDYPNAIAGEFLISGIVCVVNSIIFDAMFKLYCTIILWFYNILFSMVVIYVMFYGLSIMIGIGNDPIKEAPKRILKIVIIFALAVNAQIGFRFIHNGFFTMLNAFTEMLVDLQPYQDEEGQPAYKKSFISSAAGADFLTNQGPLLDENGDKWRKLPDGTVYYDEFYRHFLELKDGTSHAPIQKQIRTGLPYGSGTRNVDDVQPEDYVPFRVPAMQWTYKETPKNSGKYKIYPVFQDLTQGNASSWGSLDKDGWQIFACIQDVKWNAGPMENGVLQPPRLEFYPRCQKSLWPTLPNIVPLGRYCTFAIDNGNTLDLNGDGIFNSDDEKFKGMVVPYVVPGNSDYCVDSNLTDPDVLQRPPRYQRLSYSGNAINQTNINKICGPDDPNATGLAKLAFWNCRKPFQGVLSKMDSMFNSVLGNDSGKNIGALAIALALWALGSGLILAFLLMTGLTAMLFATMQLIWTYITALMSLTFMLMLAPIFVSCALFKQTENLFKGWLRACISYAMQPFLVMAFIYMLSNMSSLDRLSKLARTEITNKVYVVNEGGGATKMTLKAPSFMFPLYEKPDDFDEWYYNNANKETGTTEVFITGPQRDIYLDKKSEKLLNAWMATQSGTSPDQLHLQTEANKIASLANLSLLRRIWYNGEWGTTPGERTYRRGIRAVHDYRWYYSADNHPVGGTNPNVNAANEARFKPLIDYWDAHIDPTGTGASVDDDDAYIGEPESYAPWGSNRGAEYPRCMKYCPQFKPAYDASDNNLNNPHMNAFQDHYPDGTECPDAVTNATPWVQTPDNQPDICAPNAECLKYCMGIQQGTQNNYGYLFGAVIVWLILNIITAAFMTQVPKLAEALSRWDIMPSSGSPLPKGIVMGGASRKYSEIGMNQWTQAEKSEMFHMGGLLDTGLFSGNAGGLVAFGDKLLRTATSSKEKVDDQGRIVRDNSNNGVPYWRTDTEAAEARKQQKQMQNKVDVYKEIRSKMGLRENAGMDSGQFDIGGSGADVGKDSNNPFILQFSTLRPPQRTGLAHSKIHQAIERVVGTHRGATVDQLREYIKVEVDGLIREAIKESEAKDKNKPMN